MTNWSSDEDSDFQTFQCGWCENQWMGKVMWPCDSCGERACQHCQSKYFQHIGCAHEDDYCCPDCLQEIDPELRYCDDHKCDCKNHLPQREAELAQQGGNQPPLDFGKYRGKYLIDLKDDALGSGYCQWLASLKIRTIDGQQLATWEQKVFQDHLSFVEEAFNLMDSKKN